MKFSGCSPCGACGHDKSLMKIRSEGTLIVSACFRPWNARCRRLSQCLGPTDSDWNDKSFRVTERGCVGGRKQPASLEGADFMQFSDATVSRRHFGITFNKEV